MPINSSQIALISRRPAVERGSSGSESRCLERVSRVMNSITLLKVLIAAFVLSSVLLILSSIWRHSLKSVNRKRLTIDFYLNQQFKKPANSVFFMKTHKTAGSAIQNIMLRRALTNNLSVAIGEGKDWSRLCFSQHFSRDCPSNRHHAPFDMIAHHLRFNWTELRAVMKPGSVYITIIRDPAALVQSAYYYFGWAEYLSEPDFSNFIQHYSSYKFNRKIQLPYRNLMMYDLGLNVDQFENITAIRRKVAEVEDAFSLVMMFEYFYESLVLMKYLLNWSYEDVACFSINTVSRQPNKALSRDASDQLIKYNRADYMLYKHLKAIFFEHLRAFGHDRMAKEVEDLKQTIHEIDRRCSSPMLRPNIPDKLWQQTCKYMSEDEITLSRRILEREKTGTRVTITH